MSPESEPRKEARPEPSALHAARRPTLRELYDDWFAFVWRSARRLGACDVDDAVQETFLVAHRRLDEFEGRASPRTWLFAILANVVRTQRRSATRRTVHERDAHGESACVDAATPFDQLARRQAAALLHEALASLDDDPRAVFVCAELEEMSAPEIAEALSIPVNTVYSRLRAARADFERAITRLRSRDEWRVR